MPDYSSSFKLYVNPFQQCLLKNYLRLIRYHDHNFKCSFFGEDYWTIYVEQDEAMFMILLVLLSQNPIA